MSNFAVLQDEGLERGIGGQANGVQADDFGEF